MTLVPLEAIYTSNDTYTEVPPAGADGFSSATITVDVPSPLPLTIDRFKHILDTVLLKDFTYNPTLSTITIPNDYAVVQIQSTISDQVDAWFVSVQYNATGSGMAYNVGASSYYYLFQGGYGVFRFANSDGMAYFSFIDSSLTDTEPTYITVPKSVFNFDFSS